MTEGISGVLVAESIRVGTEIDLPGLTVTQIRRVEVDDDDPVWTLMSFHAPEDCAQVLADSLAGMLREDGGWYADFGGTHRHWVVFAGKVLSYVPGDPEGRAAVEEYARSVGLRAEYLDWRDAASPKE